MKVFLFRFRPSSHSTDYTLVAEYYDELSAKKAYESLKKFLDEFKFSFEAYVDWIPEEAHCSRRGRRVYFGVYTNNMDSLEPIEDLLSIAAKEYDVYKNYQELTITVEVPVGLTFEAATLVLDREEAEVLRALRDECEEVKVEVDGDVQRFVFHYKGDGIYSLFADELHIHGLSLSLRDKPNWRVEVEWS
ncbi:hypothetical protein B6U84_00215 [Candidatus Bathyarchaeota archaeon ex4484_40]|nr:MAG: hypothetical protein B6U84_00215 [Candidatus Bathyarchaeota archaeon ex4484_40]